ncbi:3-hydroxyacyl-CoA dehydrogenase family protein [Streptosporangium carneum]|uniref:3-hydroxybutyryl-CoA dehydrogenase n=1 Tax=Streptosporangium carneum TaxID=47481 RepID=A0A9W6I148_9ACTN|nr:3-hydroxyacyl-CoA dehydrogenase family protein [Streptosporangium carneum]GLK09516.1 3-hydroxybutyryl-CoA dehydrogenase [Streptosporangium carneum]
MKVAVIGGGRMGAGIAQVFLAADAHVTVREANEATAAAARERIAQGLRIAEAKGGRGAEEALGRLEIGSVPSDADLVVEAVPEDPALKIRVLAEAEAAVGAGAVLATNSSSLSVAELAAGLERPERFVGLHFFNPVPVQELVEVVAGPGTSPETLDLIRAWVAGIGKTGVVIKDSPGFATTRLGVLAGLEAIRMVEEGVASPEEIDQAMVLGYRHPMGPLRLSDLVGLDVRLAIAEYLCERLGPRFEPPGLLRRKVAAGELGRKTGRGFYDWN